MIQTFNKPRFAKLFEIEVGRVSSRKPISTQQRQAKTYRKNFAMVSLSFNDSTFLSQKRGWKI